MSKAVIVIDVDNDLDLLSQIHANVELYSNNLESTFHKGYLLKQVKPLPQKLDANDWHRMFSGEYAIREAKGYGYNACLKEITGETECVKN